MKFRKLTVSKGQRPRRRRGADWRRDPRARGDGRYGDYTYICIYVYYVLLYLSYYHILLYINILILSGKQYCTPEVAK